MIELFDKIFDNWGLTIFFLLGSAGGVIVGSAGALWVVAEVIFAYQGRILFNI